MTKTKQCLKETGAMATGPAIAGTDSSDKSTPLAPKLGILSRAKRMIEVTKNRLANRRLKSGTSKPI